MAVKNIKTDRIFAGTAKRSSDFVFNEEVAGVFDDMLTRSVPFYSESQYMIKEISKKFFIDNTSVYDLGCSTGTTLVNLYSEIGDRAREFIGYDSSMPMVKKAREKIKKNGFEGRIKVVCADLNDNNLIFSNASVITMCWTMQFIRPLLRDGLVKKIYSELEEKGIFIVIDKILTDSTHMNRFFIDFYYDFKKRNGYSDKEIIRKREALENVLIPYRINENIAMFRRNGFEIVETFFQWYNFVGFLCVKNPT